MYFYFVSAFIIIIISKYPYQNVHIGWYPF